MSNIGYLYVLANSSMPGLVKIGKTTRNPSERAAELSGVTGLPTPFIVVYEQLFQDCTYAEVFVHTYLEQKGCRVSDNREFFNAPVNDVIRVITQVSGAITNDTMQPESAFENESLLHNQNNDLNSLQLSILDQAKNYYYGNGDYIQDYSEALKLFHQAAKLGGLSSFGYIGKMYHHGEGVNRDIGKALEYYKEGAKKGSVYCYFEMGILFFDENNQSNAEKCFSFFVKNMRDSLSNSQNLTADELHSIFIGCFILIHEKLSLGTNRFPILDDFISKNLMGILEVAKKLYKSAIDYKSTGVDDYKKVVQYLEVRIALPEELYKQVVDMITAGKTILAVSHITKNLNGISFSDARKLADAICTQLQYTGHRG